MNKILLVEDDKEIIANRTEYLSGEGFTVKNANGQTKALEMIDNETFDLVLLEIANLTACTGFSKSHCSLPFWAVP